jgi:hypothetical protein
MTPKDLFITATRVIGELQIIHAFGYALEAFDISAGYYKPYADTVGGCLTHTVVYFLLGVYLLLGAPAVVRALFPSRTDKSTKPEDTPEI